MHVHDGAPLLAKIIRIHEHRAQAEVELTDGSVIVWKGNGALAVARQLESSIKAGHIRTVTVPIEAGSTREVHIGPDVSVVHDKPLPTTENRL